MEVTAHYQQAASQTIRDKHGVVIGRYEYHRLTGKTVARNARGILVGTFDHRAQVTRDSHGIVGTGNLLAALLVAPR